MIPEDILFMAIRGAFALGTAGIEWHKIEPRVKGKPAEEIPGILDTLYAESVQARDKIRDAMPEDPKST